MNNSLNLLIDEIKSTEEVIKFRNLEKLVLANEDIKKTLERLHEVEKQAVNAKELGLTNTYNAYITEYNEILKSFEDDVLISMYIEAKKEVSDILELVTKTIENEIRAKIDE